MKHSDAIPGNGLMNIWIQCTKNKLTKHFDTTCRKWINETFGSNLVTVIVIPFLAASANKFIFHQPPLIQYLQKWTHCSGCKEDPRQWHVSSKTKKMCKYFHLQTLRGFSINIYAADLKLRTLLQIWAPQGAGMFVQPSPLKSRTSLAHDVK